MKDNYESTEWIAGMLKSHLKEGINSTSEQDLNLRESLFGNNKPKPFERSGNFH